MPAQNRNILFIEPDQNFQELAHATIAEHGYGRVIGVATVREGLQALSTGSIDFVICDWSDDTGPEIGLLKLIKKQEVFRFIPVLLTASPQANENERVKRAAAAGVDGYLLKPYDAAQLKRAIDDVLERELLPDPLV